ncbi:MAG TPA: hypothetical protein VG456_23850 [Candidatus Sulfopaludibacter sp.]|nr:hypothetical protein [Candidatus Sulfopaludibacter sp.]
MDVDRRGVTERSSRVETADVLFGGSRFLFCLLTPVLLLFIVLTALFHPQWSFGSVTIIGGLDVLAVLMILALYNPKRFHWAGRVATSLVFLAFLVYLIDEIASGHSWHFGPRSEPSPVNALMGLLIIGVPCLRYTVLGRFGKKKEVHSEDTTMHRWLTGQCSQCPKPLAEHDWAGFASTVASERNKDRLTEFFEKVKEHDWRSVSKFQDYDATQNDMLVFAVRCVSGGFVFVVRSPFELWQDDELYLRETVTPVEMSEIESLISSDSWHVGKPSENR